MKKHLLFALCALFFRSVFSQSPQYIPYQAVARNAVGNLLVNQNISLRFTIRETSASGTIDYQETQSAATNNLGLFTVNIGNGTRIAGTLSGIPWGNGTPKFTQVEIDPTGGSSYTDMGASQMLSVPYALYAGSANSVPLTSGTGISVSGDQVSNTGLVSLTTSGNNGAASVSGTTLNIPDYTLAGLGGQAALTFNQPLSVSSNTVSIGYDASTIKLNGSNQLYAVNTGTVTSVATSSPITGGTISGSGTIACPTCATTINGGALSATAPVAISAGGIISLNAGSTGSVPYYNGSTWVINGTNLYDDGGNIGIGTTSPGFILDIGSNTSSSNTYVDINSAAANQSAIQFSSAGTQNWVVYRPGSSTDLRFYDGSADRVTFSHGGNVTVGSLAGTGNRPVYANSSGVLTTGGGLSGQTLTRVTPFSYTGTIQPWTVPTNVTQIYVKLWGAGGGSASSGNGPGGGGGFVSGVLPVTSGQILYILVGGGGSDGRSFAFGGGGEGTGSNNGGGGGGRSAIMSANSIGGPDLVDAGGGGGGAHDCYCYGGGGGGSLVGAQCSSGHSPGAGGTQSSGGGICGGGCQSGGSGYTAGGLYQGGSSCSSTWGGGGGGGFYGGAPGGCTSDEGSGGGGSSYISGLNLAYGFRNEQGSYNNNINTSGASGTTYLPGGYYDIDYTSGIGTGAPSTGNNGANGGNGYVVIYY